MKRLIDGIEIIGRTKDDGYKNPVYLIRTPQKRYIQLTELLYHTVIAMKQHVSEAAIAVRISELQNKEVDIKALRYLIAAKLEPLGIIIDTKIIFENKQPNNQHVPDMLHGLKFRITLIPEKLVQKISVLYLPLFDTRIIWSVCMGVLILNVWLFGMHGIAAGLRQAVYAPELFLLVLGLILLSSLFHEIGHATAALYGGSKPGRIGAGMYLIWPAFFTDISDVYRLGRKARLRSDFGGVYFNLVFSLLIGVVYAITGFEPLLLVILFQNLAVLQQLLPFMRLDGYFIVSDIVGIPDLFTRINPILQNVFLRKKSGATKDLKTWVKVVVTMWVVITIPLLFIIVGMMILNAPSIIANAWSSASMHAANMVQSFQQKDYLTTGVRLLQLLFLLLPAVGVCTIIYLLSKPIYTKLYSKIPQTGFFQT